MDALIRRVEMRKLVTARQIRDGLAKDFSAEHTCSMTIGIFIRIAAEAAEEDPKTGKDFEEFVQKL